MMTMTTDREARELFGNLPPLDEEAGFRPHARSLQRVVFCAFSEENYCELRLVLEELTA